MPINDGATDVIANVIKAANAVDAVTTKGDLSVGTAADTVARLGVGANGTA